MKALTVWQPWASLIMLGAKQYEFRKWDFRSREPGLVGERIVIHAGARPVKIDDLTDILERIADDVSALDAKIAIPVITRQLKLLRREKALLKAYRRLHRQWRTQADRRRKRGPFVGDKPLPEPEKPASGQILPLAAGLGTALIGEPVKATEIFDDPTNDSYRADHSIWAWPLTDIEPFDAPIPMGGAQGFWTWTEGIAA